MKKMMLWAPLLLGAALAQTAPAQTGPALTAPAQPAPVQTAPVPLQPLGSGPWTAAALQTASYLLLPPAIDGNAARLNQGEQKLVLDTLRQATAAALTSRYPGAHIVTDPATPGVISVRAVLSVPQNLNFFSSVQTRLELSQAGGQAAAQDTVSALELAAHRNDAGAFVLGRLVGKLP